MELAFTIIAGLGALLFLSGYLGFVFAGFKHHFVTGLISALPVLNIVTVPALWRNASRKFITSIFGLIIVVASWFLGANTGISKYVGLLKGDKQATQTTIVGSPSTVINNITTSSPTDSSTPNLHQSIDESKMKQLPKKALYHMSFEAVALDKIQTLKDRVVKIITTKNSQLEGRVDNVSASSIVINGSELPIANIKQISLMVKKAN
jgi:hypothetical protein